MFLYGRKALEKSFMAASVLKRERAICIDTSKLFQLMVLYFVGPPEYTNRLFCINQFLSAEFVFRRLRRAVPKPSPPVPALFFCVGVLAAWERSQGPIQCARDALFKGLLSSEGIRLTRSDGIGLGWSYSAFSVTSLLQTLVEQAQSLTPGTPEYSSFFANPSPIMLQKRFLKIS